MMLAAAEIPYAGAVRIRNRLYDRRGPRGRVPIPVISVGNITAGGTGKTPCVIALVQLLTVLGRKSAVIARGYKSAAGLPNDEELLIRAACPNVHYVADPNRVRAAEQVARGRLADVIVLDDGFQHRALHRDLDLVLIDATCPFGYEHLLPRGRLREPVASLSRADAAIVTRFDQVDGAAIQAIESRLKQHLADRPIIRARHRVAAVEPLSRNPLQASYVSDECRNVVLFAGIGRPRAFQRTVEMLGHTVADSFWFSDHHRYHQGDVEWLRRRFPRAECLLTTEKDGVKLAALDTAGMPIHVVKVAIDFGAPGLTMVNSLLEEALAKHA